MTRVKINYELDVEVTEETADKIKTLRKGFVSAIAKLAEADKPKPKFEPIEIDDKCKVAIRDSCVQPIVLALKEHFQPDKQMGFVHGILSIQKTQQVISALQSAIGFVEANQ